jgi:hypothetical protein
MGMLEIKRYKARVDSMIDCLETKLINEIHDPEDASLYKNYCDIHATPVREGGYNFREDKIGKA